MSKPIAVLISDIHYSLPTLEVADAAMRQAIAKANDLGVPLIVAGDLHDTKANLRAECVNRMLETFALVKTCTYVMIGNHDRINEKAPAHALEFLRRYAFVLESACPFNDNVHMIPYYSNPDDLRSLLSDMPKGSTLIMHQGIQGSDSGEYIQDKTAITKEDVAGLRVISGHYHNRQTIKLPEGGQWDYIGNPYTLNFGEANDPPKGFQILMNDGTLEFVPTNLRKHFVIDVAISELRIDTNIAYPENALIWTKVSGTKEELTKVTKKQIGLRYGLEQDFRLELIPTDTATEAPQGPQLSDEELLDSLIDNSTNITIECKERLKSTWKSLVS